MDGFELRHSKTLFRKVLGLHSRRRTDSVNASTPAEAARQSGDGFPTAPRFALILGARRSRRLASSAKSSGSNYRHEKLRNLESRSHRCPGDAALGVMERRG